MLECPSLHLLVADTALFSGLEDMVMLWVGNAWNLISQTDSASWEMRID